MKTPFDEIREKTQHIQNHIHWWTCPYGKQMHQNERDSLLTCLRNDAAALIASCDQMLAEEGRGVGEKGHEKTAP